jgi:hypothetical protein
MITWGGATGGGGAMPYWGCPNEGGGLRSAASTPSEIKVTSAVVATPASKCMTTSCSWSATEPGSSCSGTKESIQLRGRSGNINH